MVASAAPFQFTADAGTKSLPFTVSVNAGLPEAMVDGDNAAIAGTGFVATIVKASALEAPPPGAGLTTVTLTAPAVVTSEAGTEADSCEALT